VALAPAHIVLAVCGRTAGATTTDDKPALLTEACAALAKRDRRMNVESRGAALWVEFWVRLNRIVGGYPSPAVPFDTARGRPDEPCRTLTSTIAE